VWISVQQLIKNYFKLKIDVVLSDMAENTTGNKNVDSISISELCKEAMYFAKEILNEKGVFVSKIFMGSTFNEIILESKSIFKETKIFKPISSRKDSKESFIICKLLK
jgi:23S rRNA (uridine2552-2'-O)-methyltransferase